MKKLFVFLTFFLILLLPALIAFNLWLGKRNLQISERLLLSGDFTKAQTRALNSTYSFQRVKTFLSFFPFSEKIPQLGDWVEVGETLADVAFHLAKTGESAERVISLVLGKDPGDLEEISQEARVELDLAWQDLSLLEGILKKKPLVEVAKIREKIEIGQELLPLLPEIFGLSQRRVYLFLLQNNMELRATGGFIGSYALAIFEKGKLLDFQVDDVYTADGQLRGHVEPPAPIKKYLGEAGWYLRDANFDPDFPKTAKKVAWFFQKETGRVVDGVIGINLFVIQGILKAIGPLELVDYQETITADNLFERAEYYSEVGFFPGSTQKRDFLATLASQLFQKISQSEDWLKISKAFLESLEEKQILVSLDEEKAMRVFSKFNWDGRILENVQCSAVAGLNVQCIPDYLLVVESNFGVNKVNYFLERKLAYEIELGEELEVQLTLDYKNNSPSQVWPGGNYKNYLRVYTPLGSQLRKVKIDERILDLGKIDVSSFSEKTVFGFLIDVPVGEEKKISIRYQIPFKFEDTTAYSLLFQKQSGVGDDPLAVAINYPASTKVTKVGSGALTGRQVILYNTDLLRDRVFLVEFEKNEKTAP